MKDNIKSSKTKRIAHCILIILGGVILIGLLFNLIEYFRLKSDNHNTLKSNVEISLPDGVDKVDLVGLLDSYGVPYSDNVQSSFMDILENELDNNGQLNSKLDLFNLYINKTWHLNGIFRNGVTINEMTDMKTFSLDFVRSKYGIQKIKDTLTYEKDDNIGSQSVYDYVSNLNNPVVMYSCSANDLFYYYGTSLETLNLKKCYELIANVDEALLFLEENVRSNINTITCCNPKSQIFVMGLYIPSDNFFVNRGGATVINKINNHIQKVCDEYDNVYYVDVSPVCFSVLQADFHPDQNGQNIIAAKLADSISDNLKEFKVVKTAVIDIKPVRQDVVTADKFNDKMKECTLPMDDYVECAVAVEWVLDELGCKNIKSSCMEDIKDDILGTVDKSVDNNEFRKGYEITCIEHKILDGIIEADYSLHPESKSNDKLSLIEYYDN